MGTSICGYKMCSISTGGGECFQCNVRNRKRLICVFVPKSVNCMYEAFADCENLKNVVLEEGLQNIEKWAFFNCINSHELTIPESVNKIEPESVGIMEIREYIDLEKTAYRIKGEQVIPGFVIKCVLGSAAEKYAIENKIQFVAIEQIR